MKILMFIAPLLLLAIGSAKLDIEARHSQVFYDYDLDSNSPISIRLNGVLDPIASANNALHAFVRVASELIPLAKISQAAVSQPHERVGITQEFCLGVAARMCAIVSGEVLIGWGAEQGGSLGNYNATYTPYLRANFGVNFTLSSLPVLGGYGLYVHAARV